MFSYLFENFDERAKIVAKLEDKANLFEQYIANRCAPNPSYVVSTQQRCASYFGIHNDETVLQFFSKGQLKWITQLQQENIAEEQAAKELFVQIFRDARRKLEQSELSAVAHQLQLVIPQLTDHMLNATWQHFLEGTYGVCTKDGLPDTIAKKQVLVTLIDSFIARNTSVQLDGISRSHLSQLVDALDGVEPQFAPHERQRSSRQRCINEVRLNYLS